MNKLLEKRDKIKIVGILMALIATSVFFFVYLYSSSNAQPNPPVAYKFIVNNFNTTISNSTQIRIIEMNSTFEFNNKTYTWLPGKHIYYIGAEFCPYCASYSYVFSEAFGGSIPAFDSSFYIAEYGIPAIPISYIANLTPQDNFTFNYAENPITAQDLTQYSKSQLENMTQQWINSLPPIMQVLASSGSMPQVIVANNVGNTTYLCSAYAGIPLMLYNSTSASQFIGYDMAGVPYNTVLPSPYGLNLNYNLLLACIAGLNNMS